MTENDISIHELIKKLKPEIQLSDKDVERIIKEAQDFKMQLESGEINFNPDGVKCGKKHAIAYQVGHFIVKQKLNLQKN
jgi:hypothetical protein